MKKNYNRNRLFIFSFLFLAVRYGICQPTVLTFTYSGSIQTFTVPTCVYTMTMQARGAQGGYHTTSSTIASGLGADITGVFTVTPGQVLKILVGQQPSLSSLGNGGGGGSFITDNSNNPYVVAGGGGGSSTGADSNNKHGQTGTAGGQGAGGGGNGGTNGNGGSIGASFASGAGGGLLTNGQTGWTANTGGIAFVNGGAATSQAAIGGFGGGGSGSAYVVGGGGGGYSGGGSGSNSNGNGVGGGGGSFNGGTSQVNIGGSNSGHGTVLLTYNLGSPITLSPASSAVCNGSSVTFTASGANTYTWSTSSQQPTVTLSPNTTTTYTVSGTNSVGCVSTKIFTVTIDYTPTVSIISTTNNVCSGNTVTLNGAGAATYSWTGGVQNGQTFTPTASSSYTVTGYNACGSATAAITVSVNPLVVGVISSPTIVCSGSTATLSAAGALNYTWMPISQSGASVVVSPLLGTTYTVVGTVGPCIGTTTLFLPANPVPTITAISSASMVCEGDTATLTASGGLSYTWSPGGMPGPVAQVSPIIATLYSVVGNNSFSCTSTAQQAIVVNPKPNVIVGSNKLMVCPGGGATLTANGASTFTWSNGSQTNIVVVNPTVATVYTVTGENPSTGCTTSRTVGINVFNPVIQISKDTALCLGASITLTASGASSYTWSNSQLFALNSVTPNVTTIYSVSATSNSLGVNCIGSNSVLVTVNPLPTVTAASTRTSICKNEKTILTATGAVTYTWSNSTINSTVQVTPIVQTIYIVNGSNVQGCLSSGSITVKVNPCTAIAESGEGPAGLQIFPNPNNGSFVISNFRSCNLQLISNTGQLLQSFTVDKTGSEITIRDLAPGIYFIVGDVANSNIVKKIVVNR